MELSTKPKFDTRQSFSNPNSAFELGVINSKEEMEDHNNNAATIVEEFSEDKYYGNTRVAKEDPHANDPDTLVYMKNVHKTYLLGIEGVPALRGVDLCIKKGEFVVIFGTSGGGKTTLLNIIGTIDKPTKGELRLCGTRVTSNTKDHDLSTIRLQKIGFVFQTFNLLSSLTALENVEMPMILNGVLSTEERRARAKELLTLVGMGERLGHIPSQLSGGEQQRVTIARAVANSPDILLLDEPTGDLDTVNTLVVMKLLTELNQKQKITMIMVTHDVGLKNFADRIIWMRDGKIQRIELVDKRKKEEAIRKTEDELAEIRKRRENKSFEVRTEVRRPTDYTTHPRYDHSQSHQQKANVKSSYSNGHSQSNNKSENDFVPPGVLSEALLEIPS